MSRKLFLLSVSLCVFLCSSFFFPVYATSTWSKTYGGPREEVPYSLIATSDGGYALAGTTYNGTFGSGYYDIWLVKTDSNGVMEWNKTYGGLGEEIARALVATPDGGYAIAGCTRPVGGGNRSFWLVKTDAAGKMQWNKTYGSGYAYSLATTNDGGYALAGDSMWIKADASGNVEWNQTYGATSFGTFSLVTTSEGGYAIAGTSASGDFWLIKANSSGNMQWNRTYSGEGYCWAHDLVTTLDGGYAITGTFDDLAPFSVEIGDSMLFATDDLAETQAYSSNPYSDFWLVKTDASGNVQWNRTYGDAGRDIANSLVATSDGGYALAGYSIFSGVGGDFWLLKTDGFGNMQWNRTYGGAGNEAANSFIETVDGGFAIAGSKTSFGTGDADFWLVKTDGFGVVPEFDSWLIPALTLATTGFFAMRKKRLFRAH